MASKVDIANLALMRLGANRITSLDEQDPSAAAIKEVYDEALADELKKHVWIFAKTQANLAAKVEAPLFRWPRAFRRAADDLRLVEIGGDQTWAADVLGNLYDLQGRDILTDLSAPLQVTYIRNEQNAGQYDSSFVSAFAARLAKECCYKITGSSTMLDGMMRWYEDEIRKARRNNSIQLPPAVFKDQGRWIRARRSSRLPWRPDDLYWG